MLKIKTTRAAKVRIDNLARAASVSPENMSKFLRKAVTSGNSINFTIKGGILMLKDE